MRALVLVAVTFASAVALPGPARATILYSTVDGVPATATTPSGTASGRTCGFDAHADPAGGPGGQAGTLYGGPVAATSTAYLHIRLICDLQIGSDSYTQVNPQPAIWDGEQVAYRYDPITYTMVDETDPQYLCTTWILTDAQDVQSAVYWDAASQSFETDPADARCAPATVLVA